MFHCREHLATALSGGLHHGREHAMSAGCEDDAVRAGVGVVPTAEDEAALFKQDQHRPNRIGIRRGASGQFLLRDLVLVREARKDNELIGSHPVLLEDCVGAPMHGEVRRSQRPRQFLSFGHASPRCHWRANAPIWYVYVRYQADTDLRYGTDR